MQNPKITNESEKKDEEAASPSDTPLVSGPVEPAETPVKEKATPHNKKKPTGKEARLAAALRANLKRRKEQQRERSEHEKHTPDIGIDCSDKK